jgi:hypothetical protein
LKFKTGELFPPVVLNGHDSEPGGLATVKTETSQRDAETHEKTVESSDDDGEEDDEEHDHDGDSNADQ